MTAALSVDQLNTDADPITAALHAAFQHIAYTELTADQLEVNGFSFEGESRIPSDHEDAREARQVSCQVFGQAIREILLFLVSAHILKRQHHMEGLLGSGSAGGKDPASGSGCASAELRTA